MIQDRQEAIVEIKRYRREPYLKNKEYQNLIGIRIDAQTLYELLEVPESARREDRFVYLIPGTIENNEGANVFTAKLCRGIIKKEDGTSSEHVDVNDIYNHFKGCPSVCPRINWNDPTEILEGNVDQINDP